MYRYIFLNQDIITNNEPLAPVSASATLQVFNRSDVDLIAIMRDPTTEV